MVSVLENCIRAVMPEVAQERDTRRRMFRDGQSCKLEPAVATEQSQWHNLCVMAAKLIGVCSISQQAAIMDTLAPAPTSAVLCTHL